MNTPLNTLAGSIFKHHAQSLKDACFTITDAGKKQCAIIERGLNNIVSYTDFDNSENEEHNILRLIDKSMKAGIKLITTKGAGAKALGSDIATTQVNVLFADGLDLNITYSASVFDGEVEVDDGDIEVKIVINKHPAESLVEGGSTDFLETVFCDLGRELLSSPAEADLINEQDPYYKAIIDNVIPAFHVIDYLLCEHFNTCPT